MKNPECFLSSLDSYQFKQKREFEIIKQISIHSESNQKEGWVVKITPNLIGQSYGLGGEDIDYLILTPRHLGVNIYDIKKFPCFVYIIRIINNKIPTENIIDSNSVEVIAWGEIYKRV